MTPRWDMALHICTSAPATNVETLLEHSLTRPGPQGRRMCALCSRVLPSSTAAQHICKSSMFVYSLLDLSSTHDGSLHLDPERSKVLREGFVGHVCAVFKNPLSSGPPLNPNYLIFQGMIAPSDIAGKGLYALCSIPKADPPTEAPQGNIRQHTPQQLDQFVAKCMAAGSWLCSNECVQQNTPGACAQPARCVHHCERFKAKVQQDQVTVLYVLQLCCGCCCCRAASLQATHACPTLPASL